MHPVEVFLIQDKNPLDVTSNAHYWGFYFWLERIKRTSDRLNLKKLTKYEKKEPEVTGGYIWKVDRTRPDGSDGFTAGIAFFFSPRAIS